MKLFSHTLTNSCTYFVCESTIYTAFWLNYLSWNMMFFELNAFLPYQLAILWFTSWGVVCAIDNYSLGFTL